MLRPLAPPTRSQLFVPADRPDRYSKAVATGADALILDLEDAVPLRSKALAREAMVEFLRGRASDAEPAVLVRVNAADTDLFLDDVLAATEAGATGIALPKVCGPDDVIGLDRLLEAIERRQGGGVGSTLIWPLLETAAAIRDAYRIGLASARVAYMGGLTVRGGDIERGIGFRWSAAGAETAAFRASVLLDARAAAVPSPLTGVWTDIADLDGLRSFALQGRAFGYEGMAVIHPSHVAVVNEVFEPSEEELDKDRRLIEALADADADGSASIRFEGEMVDLAMARSARARLERAGRRVPGD